MSSPTRNPTHVFVTQMIRMRRERGWSVRRLAEACAEVGAPALTRATLSKLECGVRRFITLDEACAVATSLGAPLTRMLEDHNPEKEVS